MNLVVNAAHAIEDRLVRENRTQDKGEIVIRATADAERMVIAISDTGCGIPAHVLPRIFEPFYTTKEVGRGSGQGLSLAHSVIVGQHKGRIDVTTDVGVGTTFAISLPLFMDAGESLAEAA